MIHGLSGFGLAAFMLIGVGRVLLFMLFVYILVRIFRKNRIKHDPALYSLKMRFVNGEIDEEEYQSKVNFLSKEYQDEKAKH